MSVFSYPTYLVLRALGNGEQGVRMLYLSFAVIVCLFSHPTWCCCCCTICSALASCSCVSSRVCALSANSFCGCVNECKIEHARNTRSNTSMAECLCVYMNMDRKREHVSVYEQVSNVCVSVREKRQRECVQNAYNKLYCVYLYQIRVVLYTCESARTLGHICMYVYACVCVCVLVCAFVCLCVCVCKTNATHTQPYLLIRQRRLQRSHIVLENNNFLLHFHRVLLPLLL